jgi:DNA-binding response OmpR family regulator
VDGRDILHALKADHATCNIPVLMCSGWSEENWQVEGADGYIQKPVLYRDFLAALISVGVGPS